HRLASAAERFASAAGPAATTLCLEKPRTRPGQRHPFVRPESAWMSPPCPPRPRGPLFLLEPLLEPCEPGPELRQRQQRFHVRVALEEQQDVVALRGALLDRGQGQVAVAVAELALLGRQLVRRPVTLDGGHADAVGRTDFFGEDAGVGE